MADMKLMTKSVAGRPKAPTGAMTPEQRDEVIRLLQQGSELSVEWARILFPPERRECELVYHGKEREADVIANTIAVPLQPVRTFGGKGDEEKDSWQNKLIFGDNLQVLKSLVEEKKAGRLRNSDGSPGVRLVYIDPPFATKQEFRGNQIEKAYQDKVAGARFIEFLRKRLILIRELLADNGSVYVHLDFRKCHAIRAVLDEVFDESRFQSQIIWQRHDPHNDAVNRFGRVHDVILWYSKSESVVYNYADITDDLSVAAKKEYNLALTREGEIVSWTPKLTVPHWRFKLDDCTVKGRNKKRQFAWRGATGSLKRVWPAESPAAMDKLVRDGLKYLRGGRKGTPPEPLLYLRDTERGAKRCRVSFLDTREEKGQLAQDVWLNLGRMKGGSSYPTEKPEMLLDRVIKASSNKGDIVLDCFAGSGTTCAVAEKLGRRWIGVDCGKLSVYTIQKRMLNLRKEIGNKGDPLPVRPFTLYNAGLYDFSKLKELSWDSWRFFALQLFQCKDQSHEIGGIKLDGFLKGSSVLVFNHMKEPGVRIDDSTIESIHEALGSRVGSRLWIIAPALTFDFQQDFIPMDGVRYYALRIPYSIINELHQREFTALQQPADEMAVNDTVEAVGFDFIRTPELDFECGLVKSKGKPETAYIEIKSFKSRALVRGPVYKQGNRETLSMGMFDYDFDEKSKIFDLDSEIYGDAVGKDNWRVFLPLKELGKKIMAVFMDVYGNEARVVIPRETFMKGRKITALPRSRPTRVTSADEER